MSNEYSAIKFDRRDRVGIVTLNNPKQRNPFTPALMKDFAHLFNELQLDTELGALVITGSGGHFCAGGDIKGMTRERTVEQGRRNLYSIHDWFQKLLNLEIPVITAIDGAAYGGGFSIALASDFVLLSDRARLCCVFSRIGLVPDVGVLFTLPRIVGMQKAKELMFTARPISPQECVDLGIAMSIHTPDKLLDDAMVLANRMCEASTGAIGMTKRILNQSFQLDANALVEMEAAAQGSLLTSAYHKDAIKRFLAKEPLRFNWELMDSND